MVPLDSVLTSSLLPRTAQPDARTYQTDHQIAVTDAAVPSIGPAPVPRRGRTACAAFLLVFLTGILSLSGCVVAGVSSGGGFFIWPGSIGLLLLILVVVFLLRRR